MTLQELITNWRNYIVTPDNDYSDGVRDGLSEAAAELEDWARTHSPASLETVRKAAAALVSYNYADEEQDWNEQGRPAEGHIFASIRILAEWLDYKEPGMVTS